MDLIFRGSLSTKKRIRPQSPLAIKDVADKCGSVASLYEWDLNTYGGWRQMPRHTSR